MHMVKLSKNNIQITFSHRLNKLFFQIIINENNHSRVINQQQKKKPLDYSSVSSNEDQTDIPFVLRMFKYKQLYHLTSIGIYS